VPKPAFNAFALLHRLGDERLPLEAQGTLLTRRKDGALVLALWNYADVGSTVNPRKVVLKFAHIDARSATVQSMDREHGNVGPAYERMGTPRYPTQHQLAELREAAALAPADRRPLAANTLNLQIAPDGLMLVTVFPKGTQGARPRK
jgi:xylan 1,4-beta-xylosidase